MGFLRGDKDLHSTLHSATYIASAGLVQQRKETANIYKQLTAPAASDARMRNAAFVAYIVLLCLALLAWILTLAGNGKAQNPCMTAPRSPSSLFKYKQCLLLGGPIRQPNRENCNCILWSVRGAQTPPPPPSSPVCCTRASRFRL